MATVIAELCQNHNGDREILKDMIWAAADAGADIAKIQSIHVRELTKRERFEEGVEQHGKTKCIKRPYQPEFDRLKPLELDWAAHEWFIDECGRAGIRPMTTAFTRAAVPIIAKMGWNEVKVASYDCGSLPLLRDLAEHFDHLYISTGATPDSEIEAAANTLAGQAFTFLHCVTIYPTPLDQMHLARLAYLRRFTDSVGLSDHSLVQRDGIKASIAALACGAEAIERHFTILPPEETRDGPVSITPGHLGDLVRFAGLPLTEVKTYVENEIPEHAQMHGLENRELSETEWLNRDYYRGRFASCVAGGHVDNWDETPLDLLGNEKRVA